MKKSDGNTCKILLFTIELNKVLHSNHVLRCCVLTSHWLMHHFFLFSLYPNRTVERISSSTVNQSLALIIHTWVNSTFHRVVFVVDFFLNEKYHNWVNYMKISNSCINGSSFRTPHPVVYSQWNTTMLYVWNLQWHFVQKIMDFLIAKNIFKHQSLRPGLRQKFG